MEVFDTSGGARLCGTSTGMILEQCYMRALQKVAVVVAYYKVLGFGVMTRDGLLCDGPYFTSHAKYLNTGILCPLERDGNRSKHAIISYIALIV